MGDVAIGKERGDPMGTYGRCAIHCLQSRSVSMTLASSSHDATIKIWDLATGKKLADFKGQESWVDSVAFSPDGSTLASAGFDKTVMLWDIATGQKQATLKGHNWPVERVAFHPNGKTLVSWSNMNGQDTKLWDVASGKERMFENPDWFHETSVDYIEYIAFSPDGKTLALGNEEKIGIWDAVSGKNTAKFGQGHRPLFPTASRVLLGLNMSAEPKVCSVFFTPDGKLMALGSIDKAAILWQVATAPTEQK